MTRTSKALEEIVARVSERTASLKLSDRAASKAATGSVDLIREMKRGVMPSADKMSKLAAVLGCSLEWLVSGGGLAEPPSSDFHEHPDAAEKRAELERKADIVRAMTDDPELFAQLLAAYRDMYAEEGVPITDTEIVGTVLNDYAELVTGCDDREERQIQARAFVVKSRQWVKSNKDKVGVVVE
jgi:transcriptional regulator with XRE-family HTH domain